MFKSVVGKKRQRTTTQNTESTQLHDETKSVVDEPPTPVAGCAEINVMIAWELCKIRVRLDEILQIMEKGKKND